MKPPPLVLITAVACSSGWAVARPGASTGCAAKRDSMNHDLDDSKAAGETQRVRGLERALSEAGRNGSDAKLAGEHRQHLSDQERKVADRERELREAQRKGDAGQIARREDKVREAQVELQRIKELS